MEKRRRLGVNLRKEDAVRDPNKAVSILGVTSRCTKALG